MRHYFDLMHEGVPLQEAILRGSMERLVPILMTALTAALGLLPIVMAAGEPGSEILAPLSVSFSAASCPRPSSTCSSYRPGST